MFMDGLDDLDQKIVNLLIQNARMSYSEIGQQVGISRVAVKMRVQALEQKGIIEEYTTIINPQKISGAVSCYFEIETAPETFHQVVELLQEQETITQIYRVTGNSRLHVHAVAASGEEMERLIREAEELAEQGVKELILVAQETTLYGKDIYGEKSLHKLLKELCRINGIRWIRILYCYPEEITDELIQVMKEEPKICNYLDLPIQHASDGVLKRMGRRTTKQELTDIIGKLRKEIPDICLRTTLITGFPGETDEQHEELMEFINIMQFDRLGVFTYSPEEDTPAAVMPDQIDEKVKEERQADLMELQQDIVFENAQNLIGREMLVMIEGKVADENAYVGRTYRDAPNVDGLIFINTDEQLLSGDFARVKVTGALDYDLIGELL